METIILSIAAVLLVFSVLWLVFKKFLKLIIAVSLIIGLLVFFAKDSKAAGIGDYLPDFNSESKTSVTIQGNKNIMLQKANGEFWIFSAKKIKFMSIDHNGQVVLMDDNKNPFWVGYIGSGKTTERLILFVFGKVTVITDKKEVAKK